MTETFLSISPHEWRLIITESLVTAILAIVLFRPIGSVWDNFRYGGWKTVVIKPDGGQEITHLTAEENKNFTKSPLELIKYIKGEASNYYVRLNIKVLSKEAEECGLFHTDKKNKTYFLDLTKSPQQEQTRKINIWHLLQRSIFGLTKSPQQKQTPDIL